LYRYFLGLIKTSADPVGNAGTPGKTSGAPLNLTVNRLPRAAYRDLLSALTQEFTYTFGGCTIIRGLNGSYLSQAGLPIQDRINLIYTDTPYTF